MADMNTFGDGAAKRKFDEITEDFGHLDPEEKNYLLYHQFLSKDYDTDFGRKPVATNGWQLETLGAPMATGVSRPVYSFTGRIGLDNTRKMERIGCHSAHAFMLLGNNQDIFQGLKESLKPYYTYSFKATKGDKKGAQGKDTYFVKPETFQWEPMPLNYHIAMHIFEHELVGSQMQQFKEAAMTALASIPPADRHKPLTLHNLEVLLRHRPDDVITLRGMPIMKRLFYHDKLKHLYPFYTVHDLEHLPIQAIDTLCKHVADVIDRSDPSRVRQHSDPTLLCFWPTMVHLGLRCEDRDKVWYLPELPYAMYRLVCSRRQYRPHPVNELAVSLYDKIMARHYDEGHKFIPMQSVRGMAGSIEDKTFRNVMDMLTDREMYHALHIENIPDTTVQIVYPRRAAVCETLIVSAINSVLQRFEHDPPSWRTEGASATYPKLPEVSACSEQLRFVEYAMNIPIVNVSGQAGSGKSAGLTRYLARLNAMDEREKIVFSTYQGNNASEAQEENTSFAETAHRMLARHASKCRSSPLFREQSKKRRVDPNIAGNFIGTSAPEERDETRCKNCPFEHVKVLIVDEVGLFYDELFAILVYILVKCGKLCQIVVAGDHRQQVQIQPGRLQLDLFQGFAPWTLSYNHCHRYDDETAVIFRHNADAIDKMRPDLVYREEGIFELIEPSRFYRSNETHMFQPELTRILKSIGFSDSEKCMLVTRTHAMKDVATKSIEETQYGDISPYALRVGCKIMCTKNNYDIDMISNRVLVLEGIEDCFIPDGRTLNSLDDIEYLMLMVDPAALCAMDTQKDRKPPRRARRLRARVANRKKIVYIPYDGRFKNYVKRAAAITERSCQGSSADHVCGVKLSFWDKADVKECAYVVCTRQRKRLSLIMTEDTFSKWVKNKSKPRNSVLHVKLAKLYEKYKDKYKVPQDSIRITMLKAEEGQKYEPVLDLDAMRKKSAEKAKLKRESCCSSSSGGYVMTGAHTTSVPLSTSNTWWD